MKLRRSGIFVKTFLYTAVFAVLLVGVTAGLFSAQIISYYRTQSMNHITRSYRRIVTRAQDGMSIIESAKHFHSLNQSLPFVIKDKEGGVLFATPTLLDTSEDDTSGSVDDANLAPGGGKALPFIVYSNDEYEIIVPGGDIASYRDGLTFRVFAALLAILAAALVCAFVFARQMTKPIKQLADATGKMAGLEDVSPPPKRSDELGELSEDIHSMYVKLKNEILHERELEETQRYFFAAASHELKTPIAATSVLLEGMLENVGDYENHPKYLRECLKLMGAQGNLISEILEIVALGDRRILPAPEQLDVGAVVASIIPEFKTLAETNGTNETNGQRLSVDIPDGQICCADRKMLQYTLSNAILNAVQNTPDNGKIRIGSKPSKNAYRLYVLNTGTRIDDNVLPKLFDPFYRMDKARSQKDGRSGLGLTIVQKTLEAMGIAFALENTDDDNVLFWMDLPKVGGPQ
jgi:two-component system sensor histidine kinase VanS